MLTCVLPFLGGGIGCRGWDCNFATFVHGHWEIRLGGLVISHQAVANLRLSYCPLDRCPHHEQSA
jgi:hypothetical protein